MWFVNTKHFVFAEIHIKLHKRLFWLLKFLFCVFLVIFLVCTEINESLVLCNFNNHFTVRNIESASIKTSL